MWQPKHSELRRCTAKLQTRDGPSGRPFSRKLRGGSETWPYAQRRLKMATSAKGVRRGRPVDRSTRNGGGESETWPYPQRVRRPLHLPKEQESVGRSDAVGVHATTTSEDVVICRTRTGDSLPRLPAGSRGTTTLYFGMSVFKSSSRLWGRTLTFRSIRQRHVT